MYTTVHSDVAWEGGVHQTSATFDPSPNSLIWL